MLTAPRPRSAAAAAASRRNGALSKGPRSASGKAAAARNARKYGLFSSAISEDEALLPAVAELASFAADLAAGSVIAELEAHQAVMAAVQLARATQVLEELRDKVSDYLGRERRDPAVLADILRQIARNTGYQSRFRGRRDRLLRALSAAHQSARPAETPCGTEPEYAE